MFLPDLKFSEGIIGLVKQKKVYCTLTKDRPKDRPKQNKGKLRFPNAPPLAKIGNQPSHGGHFTSFDATSTKKSLCQRITYSLGSMLTGAIIDWRCPPGAVASPSYKKQQTRNDNDDNQQISSTHPQGP